MFHKDLEMIDLTRMDGNRLTLNAELIKWIESSGVITTVTLVTETKLMVKESIGEIKKKVINYKRLINIYELENYEVI